MKRSFGAVSVAAAVLAACSPSSSSSSSSSNGAPSVGMSPTEFATQYCALVKPCCDGAGLGPAAGCVDAIASSMPKTFDGNAAQACLASIRASSSGVAFCSEKATLADHDACHSLSTARGNVTVGGHCNDATTNMECATSPEGQVGCVFGRGGSICTIEVRGDEGSMGCVADTDEDGTLPAGTSIDGDVPVKGTYCDRSKGLHCQLSTGTCVRASSIGEPCQYEDYECAAGAYCDTTARRCKARVAVGAACTDYRSCGTDAYCDAVAVTCKKLGANGDACTSDLTCASKFCNASKRCASGFSGVTGDGICAK